MAGGNSAPLPIAKDRSAIDYQAMAVSASRSQCQVRSIGFMRGPHMVVSGRRLLFAVSLLVAGVASAHADSLDQLRDQIQGGDAQGAWAMAQRMEPESGGDPDFDFYYGLAAMQAGSPNHAVYAFERVLAQQPDNDRVRLELARAMFESGNTRQARLMFEAVLAQTPPSTVQDRIRTYLQAIDATEKASRLSVSSYVGITAGHDSNINSATDVVFHDFGLFAFTLSPGSVAADALFVETRAGVDLVHPASRSRLYFLNASLQSRDNDAVFSGGNLDYLQLNAAGGALFERDGVRWRVPFNIQALSVESDESRYLATIGLEGSRPLSPALSGSLFGQLGTIHYPSVSARNTQLLGLGAGLGWSPKASAWRINGTLSLGAEPAAESAFDFNGRKYFAARTQARYTLVDGHVLHAGLAVQQSAYDAVQPLLGFKREDFQVDLSAGWQWQIDKAWVVNGDVAYTTNNSSRNSLYDFERTLLSVGTTWRF